MLYNSYIIIYKCYISLSEDKYMTTTDYYTATDAQILAELGARLRVLRLQRNLTQEELARRALLAVGTIKSLEKGKGKLSSLVAVLRELGALEQLDTFIPPPAISPLAIADKRPEQASRQRARRRKPS